MKHLILTITLICFTLTACKVKYAFGDTNTGDAKTACVRPFTVQASLAPPGIGQVFSEKLQNVVLNQSRMELISNTDAHVQFEGMISGYSIAPVGVQQNDVSAQNRLLITVDVIFHNELDDKMDFQQSFQRFADFQSSTDISAVQDELIAEIFDLISQDVFNRAFSNW